ncbi:MAG: hypothetical protein SOR61_01335 [Evtepia sp.]|uniref:hypothetical protein n=1 Tax=Evtepia sp. TaxID=2773933 RepID=UPI002A751D24|nr:hypothetical protein [Evtepia sp.]MDY3013843.1 hypothetical protein [Evtepia sp.]
MKRTFALLLLSLWFAIMLFGCTSSPTSPSTENSDKATTSDATEAPLPETKEDVLSLFAQRKQESWVVLDCILTPDHASDRVGVVLFQDGDSVNAAFLRRDGVYQQCGVMARAADPLQLTYLGDGTISFHIRTEDGSVYLQQITCTIQGNDVSFVAKTGPRETTA